MSGMLGLEPSTGLTPASAPPGPRPILGLSLLAAAALGLDLVLSLLMVLFCSLRVGMIGRLLARVPVPPDEIRANDTAVLLLSRTAIVLLIVNAVTFLLWFHRANANLRAFRPDNFQFTPGEAVFSFVIPIVSLFRPPLVMSEIWKASDPALPPFDERPWTQAKGTALVGVWWGFFLARAFVAWGVAFVSKSRTDLESIRRASAVLAVDHGLSIVAAAAAILLIVFVQRRQEALKEQLVARTVTG